MGIKRPFVNLICTIPVLLLMGCAQIEAITKCPEPKQISGVVSEVQYITQPGSSTEKTVITFNDGRKKAFQGISNETFQKGKMNIVSYIPYTPLSRSFLIVSVKIE